MRAQLVGSVGHPVEMNISSAAIEVAGAVIAGIGVQIERIDLYAAEPR